MQFKYCFSFIMGSLKNGLLLDEILYGKNKILSENYTQWKSQQNLLTAACYSLLLLNRYLVWGEIFLKKWHHNMIYKWYSHFGKVWQFVIKIKTYYLPHMTQQSHALAFTQKKGKQKPVCECSKAVTNQKHDEREALLSGKRTSA